MAILPVDVQALLVRMNDVSKPHQREHEGAVLTQMARGEEVAKTARDESNRVNRGKAPPRVERRNRGGQEREGFPRTQAGSGGVDAQGAKPGV